MGVYDGAAEKRPALKKKILHGFGMALILASPLWVTYAEPREYFNFGISLGLGILLLVYGRLMPESKADDR
jgi:hypothetical protein